MSSVLSPLTDEPVTDDPETAPRSGPRPRQGRAATAAESSTPLALVGAGWWLAALVGLNLLLTIPLAWSLNIWQDEAFTLHSTQAGPAFALRSALYFECQPPTYFVVLSLWRLVGESLFWARLFSVLCVAGAVWLTAGISRRLLPEIHPAWAAALVGFSPMAIWSATEARCYALVIFLSAALIHQLLDGYFLGSGSRAARWRYLALALVALTTQYYLGFLLVANAAALAVAWKWRPLTRYLAGMALVGACFAPCLIPLAGQLRTHTGSAHQARQGGPVDALSETYWRLQDYAVPLPWDTPESYSKWVAFRDWLCRGAFAVGVFTLLARRWNERQLAIVSILAVQSGFFLLLRWRLGADFFIPRYTVSLLIPLLLLILSWAIALRLRPAVGLAVVVLLGFDLPKLYAQHHRLAKEGDWTRVARYLEAQAQPTEPVLVFINHVELPLARSFRGPNPLIPLPRPLPLDHYEPEACVIHQPGEVREVLASHLRPGGRFWLVTACTRPFQGIEPRADLLEAVLAADCHLASEQAFWGTRVRAFTWHDED